MTAKLTGFANKKLNEIVIPGSHDAGIYNPEASNVQTQSLQILAQAKVKSHTGQTDIVETAFHLNPKLVREKVGYQTMRKLGGWGGRLGTILKEARDYVETFPSEFLILKFSKS